MHANREDSVDGVRLFEHTDNRVEDHVLLASLFPPTSRADIPLLEQQPAETSPNETGDLPSKGEAEFLDPQEVRPHGEVVIREWPFSGDFGRHLPRGNTFDPSHNLLVVSLTALLMLGIAFIVFVVSYVTEKVRQSNKEKQPSHSKHHHSHSHRHSHHPSHLSGGEDDISGNTEDSFSSDSYDYSDSVSSSEYGDSDSDNDNDYGNDNGNEDNKNKKKKKNKNGKQHGEKLAKRHSSKKAPISHEFQRPLYGQPFSNTLLSQFNEVEESEKEMYSITDPTRDNSAGVDSVSSSSIPVCSGDFSSRTTRPSAHTSPLLNPVDRSNPVENLPLLPVGKPGEISTLPTIPASPILPTVPTIPPVTTGKTNTTTGPSTTTQSVSGVTAMVDGKEHDVSQLAVSDIRGLNHISLMGMRLSLCTGRYRQDFTEGKILGRGGFGAVFMATKSLEPVFYAVKKVILCEKSNLNSRTLHVLREVRVFSQFDHTNIVRFYSVGCLLLLFCLFLDICN